MTHDAHDPRHEEPEVNEAENNNDEAVDGELEDDSTNELKARIEELESELAQAKDQSMRVAAEAQNIRRRAEQDIDKARKFALEKFAKGLLPVADTLEKAYETMQEEGVDDVHLEGLRMTRDMQQDAFQKAGLEIIDPQGEPFNPEYHEAMAMVPNPEVEPNTVVDVMQKGYQLNGRVIRPAMVAVSKAP